MTSEAREIAARLTPGQFRALIRHPKQGYYGEAHGGWPLPAHDETSFCKAGRALMNMRLLAWHPDRRDSRTQLTRLGLAVRAELERQEQSHVG
jgi:hypothetical protein